MPPAEDDTSAEPDERDKDEQEGEEHADDGKDDEKKEKEKKKDPVQAIFDIIDRYYEGLKREKEGMGVD